MKLMFASLLLAPVLSFTFLPPTRHSTSLSAEIRPATSKSKELRFGWDGTTALGGAEVDSKPARMLDDIKASGETLHPDAELFLQNYEMDPKGFKFEEFIEMITSCYETGLIEWKNGDITNAAGENEGSAHLLSFAALADLNKDQTLGLWAQYYEDVLNTPDGTDHGNIRNFMEKGWEGVEFYNGISLTKKAVGEQEWDWDAESWIP
ncbi:hypothetical protein TrLO_g9466 [Triparma laevis f. longispina]|uniref:Uncharacterized protein n=1 Tax=Triparma laevis f. longispina TaxID=1714387 RepID=A0A9W7AQW5_9STRA|nr:hypothetical protein TrLO_g9466 [Triparma laevis f. longispina]